MDLGSFTTHTDLALDARDMAHAANQGQPIPGIEQESTRENGIRVTKINVLNEEGSKALGKLLGHYITIEVPALREKDSQLQDRVATKLAQEFEQFLRKSASPRMQKRLLSV